MQEVDTMSKLGVVIDSLISSSEERCQCGFDRHHISEPRFVCFSEAEDAVTFRAILTGTLTASPFEVVASVEEWLMQRAFITIEFVLIAVDGSCQVVIDSVFDPECNNPDTVSQAPTPAVDIILGVIGAIILIIISLAIACSCLCFWTYRKRNGTFNTRFYITIHVIMDASL